MAFTSIGFGQTCSSSTLPRWCANTSFIPSIKSAPMVVVFEADFFGILLHSFQMSCDLPQLFLLVRRQIRPDVLRITAEQVNASGDHYVQVDDACAAALPLPFAAHRNFRPAPAPGITSPASGCSIR